MNEPMFLVVDLFCGGGGTTTGFVKAEFPSRYPDRSPLMVGSDFKEKGFQVAKVIACVNHDPIAIKSHWANYPDVKHFEEDIRTLDLSELVAIVNYYRKLYPNAKLILWASLECTNFSKAKGGQPREADSRTLADHLDRYIIALDPDYVQIENVVEFMSWGPLDEKGKPVSRKNGQDWMKWRERINRYGYTDQWRELNSADYGAYTSRNRLFGIFAKPWLPIAFPQATHAKKPSKFSMHGDLKKWMAVKEVLDFEDEGLTIFNRKKPLSDKTLERIYAGLIKYVAKGDTAFISKYFSGRPAGKVNSINDPASTVTTFGNQSLIQPQFLLQTYAADSKGHNTFPVDKPARTITTRDATALVQPEFLASYYGTGENVSSIESPAPTLPTKDRISLIKPEYFIDKQYGGNRNHQSIDQPAGTIMPNGAGKHSLIRAEPFIMPTNYDNQPKAVTEPCPTITANRKHHYLVNPAWGGNPGSIDEPCCVIVARQDKAPLYFVQVESGEIAVPVYDCDSEIMIKIKTFMAVYRLKDIKMRMLRVHELLKIQGFPAGYILEGNQSDQKKFIGNSVVPDVVKAWTEALAMRIIDSEKNQVA